MSAPSSSKEGKGEQVAQHRLYKLKWLEPILEKTFFDSCETHHMYKNELNKYCMTCNKSACRYCVAFGIHRCHKMLKIYKHVYKYVVAVSAVEKHIDCSQIQTYKCNKRPVIALNPLPHKGSAPNTEICEICDRRLIDPHKYRYCSISCKVQAVLKKPDDSLPPFIAIQRPSNKGKKEETSRPQKTTNKRKGTPCRAPFF